MLKTTLKIATLSAVSLTLLSACGGGGKTPVASGVPTVNDRIASGTVQGSLSASGHNFTARGSEDSFSLRANGELMVMTVNGVSHNFRYDETNQYWRTGNSSSFDSSAIDDVNIADVIDGTHASVQGDYVDFSFTTDNFNLGTVFENVTIISGFATIGVYTPPAAVTQQTATATYTGRLTLSFVPSAGSQSLNFGISGTKRGSLTMNVDFDANTIGGTGTLNRGGTITFDSAPISGNGFAGSFRLDGAARTEVNLTNNPVGNYSGNFFGPDADDIAGVMQMNGTHANGTLLGVGGFRGDRDTQ